MITRMWISKLISETHLFIIHLFFISVSGEYYSLRVLIAWLQFVCLGCFLLTLGNPLCIPYAMFVYSSSYCTFCHFWEVRKGVWQTKPDGRNHWKRKLSHLGLSMLLLCSASRLCVMYPVAYVKKYTKVFLNFHALLLLLLLCDLILW